MYAVMGEDSWLDYNVMLKELRIIASSGKREKSGPLKTHVPKAFALTNGQLQLLMRNPVPEEDDDGNSDRQSAKKAKTFVKRVSSAILFCREETSGAWSDSAVSCAGGRGHSVSEPSSV